MGQTLIRTLMLVVLCGAIGKALKCRCNTDLVRISFCDDEFVCEIDDEMYVEIGRVSESACAAVLHPEKGVYYSCGLLPDKIRASDIQTNPVCTTKFMKGRELTMCYCTSNMCNRNLLSEKLMSMDNPKYKPNVTQETLPIRTRPPPRLLPITPTQTQTPLPTSIITNYSVFSHPKLLKFKPETILPDFTSPAPNSSLISSTLPTFLHSSNATPTVENEKHSTLVTSIDENHMPSIMSEDLRVSDDLVSSSSPTPISQFSPIDEISPIFDHVAFSNSGNPSIFSQKMPAISEDLSPIPSESIFDEGQRQTQKELTRRVENVQVIQKQQEVFENDACDFNKSSFVYVIISTFISLIFCVFIL